MRHLLVLALALATPWGAQAVGIGSVGPQPVVPNATASAPMPGATKPGPAAPAATAADTGPIVHRFEYDAVGNRTRHIDAESRATRWEHDKAGRVTARILPGGQRETMAYNLVGELVEKTDFLGRTTRYTYDRGGRVATIDYPGDGDVAYTYTAMGLRESVTDGHGTTRYSYDRRDRLTGVEFPHGGAVAYDYDAAGNRTALITAYQRVGYVYDARNRLEAVSAPYGTTRFTYDAVGNRASVSRPNGIRTEYAYDARNRLTGLAHRRVSDGTVLFGVAYVLEADGQRSAAEERDASGIARTITWTYDNARRLTGETIVARDPTQSRTTTWTYDKVGNRLTQALTLGGNTFTTVYAYDTNDRLLTETTGATVIRYTYDANGNTRSRSSPNGLVEYAYDDQDRLIEQRDASGRRTYLYDPDGLRIGETKFPASGPPVTTSYVFDKGREYATVIEEFVQEGEGPRRLAATFTYGDDLIAQTRGEATHYVHADGMSSTRLLTDAAGTATDTYAFDAFGNEIARSGSTIVAHLYRGEQFDPNLGFYYLRARFYDPKSGRFQTMDTFEGFSADPPTLHKYLYANTDPIQYADPSGHMGVLQVFGVNLNVAGALSFLGTRAGAAAMAKFSAELAFEYATGIPVITSPRNLVRAVRSLKGVAGNLASGAVKRLQAGRDFESLVRQMWGLRKNSGCYKGGVIAKPPGCYIPDFLVTKAGRLVEVKTSMGAVKKLQFQEFINIARASGQKMTMVFLKKPTPGEVEQLQRWALEVTGPSDDLLLSIIHVLD